MPVFNSWYGAIYPPLLFRENTNCSGAQKDINPEVVDKKTIRRCVEMKRQLLLALLLIPSLVLSSCAPKAQPTTVAKEVTKEMVATPEDVMVDGLYLAYSSPEDEYECTPNTTNTTGVGFKFHFTDLTVFEVSVNTTGQMDWTLTIPGIGSLGMQNTESVRIEALRHNTDGDALLTYDIFNCLDYITVIEKTTTLAVELIVNGGNDQFSIETDPAIPSDLQSIPSINATGIVGAYSYQNESKDKPDWEMQFNWFPELKKAQVIWNYRGIPVFFTDNLEAGSCYNGMKYSAEELPNGWHLKTSSC
jgi:hypothetical protein